jgi:cation transport ATPase
MEAAPHKDTHPQKNSDPLISACVAFAGFGLLLLLPVLFFSLGPMISTGGRAWEYEPVRELLIAGVIIFLLIVVSPSVAAYSLSRGHGRAKALVMVAAISSALVGSLFVMIGISMAWAGCIIITTPCFASSAYAFRSLRRKGAV